MKSFDFNGRNYKVVNGLTHEACTPSMAAEHGLVLIPIYKGDNLMLDAYCKELGVRVYDRPLSDGDPDKEAYNAMTKKWVAVGPGRDADIKVGKFDFGRIVKLWARDDHGAEHVGTFFIPNLYSFEDIERYAQEWYQGKSYSVPFEIWIKEKWSVAGVIEVCIPAIYV